MASKTTTKKKNGSGAAKKPDTRARKNTRADNFPPPQPPARPIHREVSGVVFLFLAVFMVIACFNTDGAFIAFFANLVKGLIGWGFWLTAAGFSAAGIYSSFSQGAPGIPSGERGAAFAGYCRGHASAYAVRFHVGKF